MEDQENQGCDEQPTDGWNEENTIPGKVRQNVQGQIGRTDSEPLSQLDEFSKDNGPTAGDGADGTGQGNEREGLNLIELLAETLAKRLFGRGRRQLLSVLRAGI